MATGPSGASGVQARRALLAAERGSLPFLTFDDPVAGERVKILDRPGATLVIGRRESCDVAIDWDDRVSRVHAEILPVGSAWAVSDDGLSRNGTFVNEERTVGRRRLQDRDVIRVGRTRIVFRDPRNPSEDPTKSGTRSPEAAELTPAQRRVLEALARPCLVPGVARTPATNQEIAAELHLTVDAVKAHLRQMFRRFGLDDLPQVQKRSGLVRVAIDLGLVRPQARQAGDRAP